RSQWRWSSGPTANTATSIFRRHQRTRASAPTSARSAQTVWSRCCTTFARTAAEASCRGRSGRRENGGQGLAWANARLPPSAWRSLTAVTTSRRIRRASATFRPKSDERPAARGSPRRVAEALYGEIADDQEREQRHALGGGERQLGLRRRER